MVCVDDQVNETVKLQFSFFCANRSVSRFGVSTDIGEGFVQDDSSTIMSVVRDLAISGGAVKSRTKPRY